MNPSLLHRWRREFRQGPGNVFPGLGKRRWEEGQVAQLERKIGQQALEIDFLKGCLQRIDEQRKLQALDGKAAVYEQIQSQRAGGSLDGETDVRWAEVSRSGFYRFPRDTAGAGSDMKLRDAMQRIALEFPSYGWPRMTAELRRRGWAVNHKRVYRLMRQDNLLCLRRRKFVVTTDSGHGLPVYPNLARALTLTGLDQLWVADITYIRLEMEFVYLAVILDAFSRRVIGWALDRTLEAALTLEALHMALARRRARGGTGASLRSRRAVRQRRLHAIAQGPRHPHQHVAESQSLGQCRGESFMKTLKYEEVYRTEYRDLPEAQASIGCSWRRSTTKNACTRRSVTCRRPSSSAAAGRKNPQGGRNCAAASLMSFLRHGEIYRPMDSKNVLGRPGMRPPRRSSVRGQLRALRK